MAGPASLTMLGSAFGRHPAWVRHHLLRLIDAGLVELDSVRKIANYTEKRYRSTADAYSVQMLVVPDDGRGATVIALGSDDPALRALASFESGEAALVPVSVGSLEGLIAVRSGLADIAGCHLLDVDSDEYNTPYVRRLLSDRDVTMITLAHREQGLVVAAGNPLRLRSMADVVERRARFANRNAGSGTRVWIDRDLAKRGLCHADVLGYGVSHQTHLDAVSAVARSDADATVAIRAEAEAAGLGFVPLFVERYDLVANTVLLERPDVAAVLDRVAGPRFRRTVARFAGYDNAHTGDANRLAV
jgi:putative molybdopterin biosynthesis protein